MSKPIFYSDATYAFDATKEKIFRLRWTGNQSVKITLRINDNETNTQVYLGTQEGLQLKYVLPSNSILNGKTYNCAAKITDIGGNESEWSDVILFTCITTPSFSINVTDNQIINNSMYDFKILYSQIEGELLQSYQIILFNNNKSQIYSSGLQYDINSTIQYSGFEDNAHYYVQATGITINGMEIETDLISFSVDYILPISYSYLVAENRSDYGDIKLSSNLVSIEGRTEDDSEPIFIEKTAVDATNTGIIFDENLLIETDFTICFSHYNLTLYEKGLTITNGSNFIVIKKQRGKFNNSNNQYVTYFDLTVLGKNLKYYVMSNYIKDPADTDLISVWIKKKNGLFDIFIRNESEDV